MKASGPRQERETIIHFNEENDMATIWTASEVVYRRLSKRLGTGKHLIEDLDRHAIFEFPKKWLVLPRIKTPKKGNGGLPPPPARSMARMANLAKQNDQSGGVLNIVLATCPNTWHYDLRRR